MLLAVQRLLLGRMQKSVASRDVPIGVFAINRVVRRSGLLPDRRVVRRRQRRSPRSRGGTDTSHNVRASWDPDLLRNELRDLQSSGFELDLIGFEHLPHGRTGGMQPMLRGVGQTLPSRNFAVIAAAGLLQGINLGIHGGLAIYFITYYCRLGAEKLLWLGLASLPGICSPPFLPSFWRNGGAKETPASASSSPRVPSATCRSPRGSSAGIRHEPIEKRRFDPRQSEARIGVRGGPIEHRHPEDSPAQKAKHGDQLGQAFRRPELRLLGPQPDFRTLWNVSIFPRRAYQ